MTRRAFDRMNKTPSWTFPQQFRPPQQKQRKAQPMQPKGIAPQQDLWPLGILAFELGLGTRDLEHRCNGAVVRNSVGLRCIPSDLVRELVAERDDRLARQRERAVQAQAELAELSRRNRELLRGGRPASVGGTALADLRAGDESA
jgi:hypothetical protein